jgi:hypothetical protein
MALVQVGFGSGLLYGIRTDIAVATPRRLGIMQDVALAFAGDAKELFGQFQYPVAVARGKTKITGKAKFAEINADTYNDFFFGQNSVTGGLATAFAESHAIPATTPYTFVVTNATLVPLEDLGAWDGTTGRQFIYTATSPPTTTGQYHFDPATGTYSFSVGDEGKTVLVDYRYTLAATAPNRQVSLFNLFMGTTPVFKSVFTMTFQTKQTVLELNACVATSFNLPTRIDDFVISDLDFQAQADAAGNVGTLTTTIIP